MQHQQSTKRKTLRPNLFETRDLIRLVKERTCLWDRNDPDYRDRTLKEAAWMEIYKVIEPDFDHFNEDMKNLIGSQITRKWYNVRDSFVKSKKHCNRNRPYIYSKLLGFLEPVYFEDKEKTDENESGEQWLDEVFLIDEESETKRPKPDYEKPDSEDSVIKILANLVNREEDDDRSFFKSIIPAVKQLSDDSRMEFRIQVMNVLQSLRNRDKNNLPLKKEVEDIGEEGK